MPRRECWEQELHCILATLHGLLGTLYEGAETGKPCNWEAPGIWGGSREGAEGPLGIWVGSGEDPGVWGELEGRLWGGR